MSNYRRFVSVDAGDAVRFVAASSEGAAEVRGVRVEHRVHQVGSVEGDESRLIMALLHTVAVAIDLASPGTEVAIVGDRTSDALSLAVCWRGPELRADQRLWELTGGDQPRDRVQLSCVVARQLAQLHRGRLRFVRSGETCQLVLTLPVSASRPPPSMRG